jgi:hypothetical protein
MIFKHIGITVITLLMVAVVLVACGASLSRSNNSGIANESARPTVIPTKTTNKATSTPIRAPITSTLPAFSHIFIIVMENKDEAAIASDPDADYLNKLAAQYGRATNYYGIRHPSLPNYLAMTAGDTFSITSDCTKCFVNQDNLAAQLEAKGRSWKAYMESMPSPCFVGSTKLYAQKHNPFIYYDNIRNDPARCSKIVPLTQLESDLKTDTVPDFVWITPNMCNDTHDCPVKIGDQWLQTWIPKILASSAWKNKGVLFITYDEGKGSKGCCQLATGGQIMTLVISPLVESGFVSDVAYNHYSLLRTIEEAWGLPLLGNADCDCTQSMADFFVKKN